METLRTTTPRANWRRVFGLPGLAVMATALVMLAFARHVAPSDPRTAGVTSNSDVAKGVPGELCSARNAVGVGLRGQYFAQPGWQGTPVLSRTDASIDFDASLDWPSDVPAPRSVRWQGWVKAPISGLYRFHLDHANAHIVVARQEAVSADGRTPAALELQAGRFYPITIEIERLDAHGRGSLALEWTAPHGARYVVPRALLFLPSETASPRAPAPRS